MVDRGAVESRARRIDAELEVLEHARTGGREPYLRNRSLQREVERALEVSIQACIDIGAHLVAVWGLGVPEDYADVFERLSREDELDRGLAERMKEAAGQRNMLVHVYLDIDHMKIWDKLGEVDDLRAFARWALEEAGR
jgi:uncharacterized protein YutE (UPF0331/DUF86 family)